ncbi:ComEA family DNA-binding protein [Nocardioides coralli]|uniref:ComEA family DNA-binding protein n=1 Tax=Nocardioides coralli TaxID=2872154 RepID=UPI001CA3F593|nr:ComEA family DNA-binding protein [Nocardioides coralli]QZY30250.1 ComEA family DNA-binding protein [Nocardioides coralli]
MASRPTRAEHDAAVSRRLGQLAAELAAAGSATPSSPAPAGVRDSPPEAAPVPEPAPLPVPGRHASRRPRRHAAWLPEPLRGRVGLGPGPVAVVAVLVAVGLAVTTWWVVRSGASEVVPVTPTSPADPAATSSPLVSSPAGPATAPATASDAAATVTVDVAGKVHRPGIVVLDAGARVVDALEAAGGARRGVDLTGLNLARVLVDGEQILVGLPVLAPTAALPTGPGPPAGSLVNINTASLTELETLPEVGPVTAQAIVSWREENGGFTATEELLEVDGIGEATLEAMAPFVTV